MMLMLMALMALMGGRQLSDKMWPSGYLIYKLMRYIFTRVIWWNG